MATINLDNPSNISSAIQVGIRDASFDDKTISVALTSYLDSVRDGYKEIKDSLAVSLTNWVVTSVETQPAPTPAIGKTPANVEATTQVVHLQNGELELVLNGELSNTNKTFSLNVTGMRMVGANCDFGLLPTQSWTVKFVQDDSGKTYETQVDSYNGSAAGPITVGALPIGARLTDIGGTPSVDAIPKKGRNPEVPAKPADPFAKLPIEFTQITLDLDNGESTLALGGTFNINKNDGVLTGTLKTLNNLYQPDGELGLAARTFEIQNGEFASTFTPQNQVVFNSSKGEPGIQLVKEEQTDAAGAIHFARKQFDFPIGGTSTTSFKDAPSLPLAETDISLLELGAFSGNDTISVTSTTDVTIFAGAGNDTVTAGAGNDIIYGGRGDDDLKGQAGNDVFVVNHSGPFGVLNNPNDVDPEPDPELYGSSTNTEVTKSDADIRYSRLGNDVIDGGAGNDVLRFNSLPGDLQLVLPAQWGGSASSTRGIGSGYTLVEGNATWFGKYISTIDSVDYYGEIKAPTTEFIGFLFANTENGSSGRQNEYVHVKNVEFLEFKNNDNSGSTTYDIRPLYLATSEIKDKEGKIIQSGVDNMSAFSREAFDKLVTLLDQGASTKDPLSVYRNQFSIFQGSDKEWRYYLNSGSGNDTLYGTSDRNVLTATDLITLSNDIDRFSELFFNLTKENSEGKSFSIDVDEQDENDRPLYLTNGEVDFGKINAKLVAELNNLNVGVSAQRFNDNMKVLVSGLDQSGWTLSTTDELASIAINTDDQVFDRGRDILDGGAGADTMIGESGSDSYYVDNTQDQVIESGWHSGFDVVLVSAPDQKSFAYVLQADSAVERIQVHQIIAGDNGKLLAEPRATAPTLAKTSVDLTGNNFTYEFLGHDGANTITAGQFSGMTPRSEPIGGALLIGMGGKDTLIGGELNDHFFGGTGNDTLQGGKGDDSFYMGFTWSGRPVDGLLPVQYKLLNQLNADEAPDFLSGGNDVASGGAGHDVVVVGLDLDESTFYTQLSFQRMSETSIKIATGTESITVDSSVEAVRFVNASGQIKEILLPWVVSEDERARDLYYDRTDIDYDLASVPSSEFSDYIDLNGYALLGATDSSIDAGKGNDIVYGSSDGEAGIRTVRGGDGHDWIYGGEFVAQSIDDRYELYGNDGDDTITLDASQMLDDVGIAPRALLDGGSGNDHYRISLSDIEFDSPKTRIRIADSGPAKDIDKITYTLPSSPDANLSMQWAWEGNELRLMRLERTLNNPFSTSVYLAASVGTIEQLYVTGDDRYFSTDVFGGNLVNPDANAYATGKLKGGDGADFLVPMMFMALNYDGGKGDDMIVLNNITGGVATGGLGNNRILVDDHAERNPIHSLSYLWTEAGHSAEIDLSSGYSFVTKEITTKGALDRFELVASDRFETGYFANVLGGAGNETVKGNDTANRIDGGAGNDILYSGQNALPQNSPPLGEWQSMQPGPVRDVLIGGSGNDILVEEAHWGGFSDWEDNVNGAGQAGSLLDGGAGDDTYVLQHNGAPAGRVTPTKIVEAVGGGSDTLRFVSEGGGIPSFSYVQTGNTVKVMANNVGLSVGDGFVAQFATATNLTNVYNVTSLIKDSNQDVIGFEFLVPTATSASLSGTLSLALNLTINPIAVWADANTLAVFQPEESHEAAINTVGDGNGMINDYDGNSVQSPLAVQALIDRNALDNFEMGSSDPLSPGVRLPISFNTGKSDGLEMVIAGANGDAVLYGGSGSDMLLDTSWTDILIGGNGNDVLSSNFGQDILLGGAGNDTLLFRSDGQILVGGAGADNFVVKGVGNGPANIIDYKPWEGDKLMFDNDWLDQFTQGKNRTDDIIYSNLLVTANELDEFDDHINYQLMYSYSLDGGDTTTTGRIDLMSVSISADHDQAEYQDQMAQAQLIDSLNAWRG